MELYTTQPSKRLLDKIDKLTNLAKSKYNVDMGPLFTIRSRNVSTGNQLMIGSDAFTSKIRLEPNEAAFEAIDRSKKQEANEKEQELRNKARENEALALQEEGNYVISSEGDVIVPTNFPKINIKC